MITIRPWIGLAVFLSVTLIPVALRAQTPQEWASAPALGDVFQGTHNAFGVPLIKVFSHGGVLKDQITLNSPAASITSFALDAENNLFVATDAGTIFKVNHTLTDPPGPPPPAHQPVAVLNGLTDVRTLAFDEDGKLYVGYGGPFPKIERYTLVPTPTLDRTHNVQCDVSPAPGLWFDLTARTPTTPAKQFAVYACGTKQIRSFDFLSTPPPNGNTTTTPFATLPDLPGSVESARDIRLLAPTAAIPVVTPPCELDGICGTQGGLVVAYGTNIQWLDRLGAVIGSFDFNDGPTSQNSWCCIAISPTGGSVWGAETNSSALTRFRLSTGFSPQPELRFDTSSILVTALAVNGEPRLAQAMQLTTINGAPANFLKNTTWRSSLTIQADLASAVRVAVTSFEARSGGPSDLNIDGRFNNFPLTTAVSASRGRANFYRVIKQSLQDISGLETTIAVDYNLPTTPAGFITGLYSDTNHSPRGFVQDTGGIDQVDKNIRTEWFKTNEIVRGKTIGTNDFIVATQTGSTATLGSFRKSVELGGSLPIRASYSFPIDDAFCAQLVLTVARKGGPPWIIVGSSLTTLNDLGEGIPFFAPTAMSTCASNLQVDPNQSEIGLNDFAAGRSYNFCVISTAQAPNQTPASDVCGTFSVK